MTLYDRNREIRRVRVADILDNPSNYRTHDDAQRGALQAVVHEIGWYGYPDVFEHPSHPGKVMLVDGELRTHHLIEHYGADAVIDVNVTDFDQDEADKALATKDPLGAMAKIDLAQEAELLRSLQADSEQFGDLVEQLAAADYIDLDPLPETFWEELHAIPEPSAELADFWDLSPGSPWQYQSPRGPQHRVLIGDPGNAEHLEDLLAGEQPELLVTVPRAGNSGNVYRLFPGAICYVFVTPSTTVETVGHLHEHSLEIRAHLIWRYETEEAERSSEYHTHHQSSFYAVRRGASAAWTGTRKQTTVWDSPAVPHGALPLEIAGRPMINHAAEHGVLDPFGEGTLGSVAIAADRLGRPSFTLCQDREHAAVVVERLMREWGRTP